jgi:hypothetical protein
MRGARHDLDPPFDVHLIEGHPVEPDHHVVEAADDEQGGRLHVG